MKTLTDEQYSGLVDILYKIFNCKSAYLNDPSRYLFSVEECIENARQALELLGEKP